MKTSTSNRKNSRHAFARLGKIASAAAFGLLIGAFAIGTVHADDHHRDHDRGRGHEEHEYHGRGYYRGPITLTETPTTTTRPHPTTTVSPSPTTTVIIRRALVMG